jgi:hypothetical protein
MLCDTTSRYFARRQEMSIRRIVSELLVIRPQFAKNGERRGMQRDGNLRPDGHFRDRLNGSHDLHSGLRLGTQIPQRT